MNVNFPPVDENYIRSKVENGYYSNATELVRDAVRRMRERDESGHRRARIDAALREALDDVEAGRVEVYTPEFWDNVEAEAEKLAESGTSLSPEVLPHD